MTNSRTKILDLAESLTQTHGFNGFSYLDLSEGVGIKRASIHYYFKSKADLALALVERIQETHAAAFANMDIHISDPEARLATMVDFFENYVTEDKFCMCGMLSAELQSVSPAVRNKLAHYFDEMRAWVSKQFSEMGREDAPAEALSFVSALEGSTLLARLNGDPSIVQDAMKQTVRR